MEHRWGQRLSVDIAVRIGGTVPVIGLGRMLDVSMSGAFVATALRPSLFGHVEIEIPGPETSDLPCSVAAFVVRHDTQGIGVEWGQFAPAQIAALLQRLAPEHLAPLGVALDQYRRLVVGSARP